MPRGKKFSAEQIIGKPREADRPAEGCPEYVPGTAVTPGTLRR